MKKVINMNAERIMKTSVSASDPIRNEFRDVGSYVKIAADLFLLSGKYSLRPQDWAVLGRVLSHLGVRGLQQGFKLQESVDARLRVASEIGDATFKFGSYLSKRAGVKTTHVEKTTAFENELEKIAKE